MKKKTIFLSFFFSLLLCPSILISAFSEHEDLFLSHIKRAEIARQKGDFKSAFDNYSLVNKLAISLNKDGKIFNSLINQGIMLWQLGLMNEAFQKYSNAYDIAKKLNNDSYLSFSESLKNVCMLYFQGKTNRKNNNYIQSIESFQKAIEILDAIGISEKKIKCLRQLGLTYWAINDLYRFNMLNEEALSLAEQYNHQIEQINCLINIGIYQRKSDNLSAALVFYEKALILAKKKNIHGKISACLNNIGIIYKDLGNYEKSIQYLEESLSIDESLNNEIYISIDLINLGETIRLNSLYNSTYDELQNALAYFVKALSLAKKNADKSTEVRILNNIGATYSDLKNNEKALEFFNKAFNKAEKINDIETMGMTLNNLGVIYHNLGEYIKSNRYFDKAINLAKQINRNNILWEAYLERGNNARKQNQIKGAVEYYKKSIEIIENIRSQITLEENRTKFFGTDKRIDAYYNIVDAFFSQIKGGKNKENLYIDAFNYMEKAKARSFLDNLCISNLKISNGINSELHIKENNLMSEFSHLYHKLLSLQMDPKKIEAQLRSLEAKFENLKREIRENDPLYANLKYPEQVTIENTQQSLLNETSAIFAYMVGNENSYLFMIQKNEIKLIQLQKKGDLKKLVRKHLMCITDINNNDFSTGVDLYSSLFSCGINANVKNIIIIPDGFLNFLPFETLITKQNNWLGEEYNISYAPSISSLFEIKNNQKKQSIKPKKYFLGIGNPSFEQRDSKSKNLAILSNFFSNNNLKFNELKYANSEIRLIGSMFNKNKKRILLNSEATEKSLKESSIFDYKIIHFASHSIIDNKRPDRSSLILSIDDNSQEDGLLQTREIFNLDLNADLVTISSCESGLGQLVKGEGIEGLNRAFFYAGTSAVLMSLWAINDHATSQLMRRFYKHLKSSKTIVESLKLTKHEMIISKELSHPYYWAGFIVSGYANRKVFKTNSSKSIFNYCLFLFVIIFFFLLKNFFLKKRI